MMSSADSGQGESLCTPKRVQKRLFGKNVSSSKKNLFQSEKYINRDEESSGEESDLGPMSPLEATESSSYESSPGRQYESPFTTPDNSPRVKRLTWDRLRLSSSTKKSGLSPFSSLRKLTKEARATPRRRIFANSPKSIPGTPDKKNQENFVPSTPKQIEIELNDDIVPETPQKDFVAETPQKENFSEQRLITPLGSVCKQIIIPPLHRRKSICTFDSTEESSPEARENLNKRHANESLNHSSAKIPKTDDEYFIPKARASLFKEDKNKPPKFVPLSTKSFYNNNNNVDDGKRVSFGFGWKPTETESKKRHSLPAKIHRRSSGSAKRPKFGQINAGVKHSIKRPKPKRRTQNESFEKKQKSPIVDNSTSVKISDELKENDVPMETINASDSRSFSTKAEKTQPIVEDPNKKFFKTNRTIKSSHIATVTVNDKIKLKVSDGKIARQQKKGQVKRHVSKKPKLDPVVFDTTDLNVDEPELEDAVNDKEVAILLKILEDDWADDDYDNMGSIIVASTRSPQKSTTLSNNNVLMSPASVLSTMTSSMNIKEQNNIKNSMDNSELIENQESSSKVDSQNKKLFPIFDKDHSSILNTSENIEKKGNRGIKRPHSWQLSLRANGDSSQYQLDAGQKRFGSTQCSECDVVYQIGEPEDENAHLVFHNNVKKLKFNGWKNEHVVYEDPFTRSRIITVEPSDSKHCWNKVDEILAIVDEDLGLTDINLTDHRSKRVYLYIRDKNIIGVLVAEPIKTAHRMIPDLIELNCCEEEETSAKCGVNVIWTALSHRKQGVARKLMDILRSHFYYGYIMSIDDIAFSIPTQTGKIFAEKYMGGRNFKVYS